MLSSAKSRVPVRDAKLIAGVAHSGDILGLFCIPVDSNFVHQSTVSRVGRKIIATVKRAKYAERYLN